MKPISTIAFIGLFLLQTLVAFGQVSYDNNWIKDVIIKQEKEKSEITIKIEQLKEDIQKNEKTISTSNSIISLAKKNGNSQAEKIAGKAKLKAEEARKTNLETLKSAEIRLENAIIALKKIQSKLANNSLLGKKIQSIITGCKGTVYVKKENGEVYDCNKEEGVFLEKGDIVQTFSDSKVSMQFLDGRGIVTVDQNSKIKVYSDGDITEVMDIIEGKVKLEILKAVLPYKKKFEIRTPSAVTSVRGTQLQVSTINQDETEIIVFEGIVDVKSIKSEKSIDLNAGYKMKIAKDGTLSDPEQINITTLVKWWEN